MPANREPLSRCDRPTPNDPGTPPHEAISTLDWYLSLTPQYDRLMIHGVEIEHLGLPIPCWPRSRLDLESRLIHNRGHILPFVPCGHTRCQYSVLDAAGSKMIQHSVVGIIQNTTIILDGRDAIEN